MKTKRLPFLLLTIAITVSVSATIPTRKGWWKFDDATDMLKATIGNSLTTYGSTPNESVNGPVDGNLAIMDPIGHALIMNHGIGANGGGSLTNEYSFQIDFMIPSPIPSYVSFFQTGEMNDADGDLFAKANGTIGLGALGWSTKTIVPDTWYRMIVSAKCGEYYRIYINGELYLEKLGITVDSRHALKTMPYMFGDDDGEDPTIFCSELAVWDTPLTEEQAIELGNASQPVFPARQGWWKFDDPSDLLKAEIGNVLTTYGSEANMSVNGPTDGNLAIMDPIGHALIMDHGIGANGGGTLTNEYSMQIDFSVSSPIPSYVSFFQTGEMNDGDGDLFIKANGTIGLTVLGWSTKTIASDTWYRMIVTAKCGEYYRVYINGELYLEKLGIAVDSRHALKPQAYIFGDDDGEDPAINCSELGIWNIALSAEQVAQLGNANGEVTGLKGVTGASKALLGQNHPNPASNVTVFPYSIEKQGNVTFTVFDLTGKQVMQLNQGIMAAGSYKLSLNINGLNSGMYYVQLNSENTLSAQKMLVIK